MYTVFVCEKCGWGQFHQLNYCIKCPGKMRQKRIPEPENLSSKTFPNEAAFKQYIKDNGVVLTREYSEKQAELERNNKGNIV